MIVASRPFPSTPSTRSTSPSPARSPPPISRSQLFAPEIETAVVPFDRIIPEVRTGNFEAGLIIHEGQLTYAQSGLHKVLDLGQWWREETGLPLPLGGDAIRRSLGDETMRIVTQALRDGVRLDSITVKKPSLTRCSSPATSTRLANKFVGMYVNERTLNYGEDGREAIRKLLALGHERGIIPHPVKVDFVRLKRRYGTRQDQNQNGPVAHAAGPLLYGEGGECAGTLSTSTADDHFRSADENLQIEPEAPVFNVGRIQGNIFREGGCLPCLDLP